MPSRRNLHQMSSNSNSYHPPSPSTDYYPTPFSSSNGLQIFSSGYSSSSSSEDSGSPKKTISNTPEPEEITSLLSTPTPIAEKPVKVKKTYQCSHCPKFFSRPSALATHTYTHTYEKPFQCQSPGCGRRFSVVSNLRRHFKVHQKPFNGNRLTSQDRIQCVRQLIQKKNDNFPSSQSPTTIDRALKSSSLIWGDESGLMLQENGGDSYFSPSPPPPRSHHYLLLPPIIALNANLNTNTATYNIASQNNHYDSSIIKEVNPTENFLNNDYAFPYSWYDHTSNVNIYLEEGYKEYQQQQQQHADAEASFTNFGDLNFLDPYQPQQQ